MNNMYLMSIFNWKNSLIGRLEKSPSNQTKIQYLQGLTFDWKIGNFQSNFPIFQLSISHCYYWVFGTFLIGEKTPILKYGHSVSLMPLL